MLNISTHKKILLRVLSDIYSDSALGPFLGFKGGTAAYFFYGLPRFSVDLDFDLLDKTKEDYVFEKIEKILKKYGDIKEAKKKKLGLFFALAYDKKEKKAQNIKIEINQRDFGSEYELKSYLGISMLVMAKGDMFANKLMAMSERLGKTNRDIFDVWFFAQNNWPIKKEIIEKRSGMEFREFLQKTILELEKISNRNILGGMGELLNEEQKKWVKLKLKTETLFLLKLILESEKI